MKTQYTVATGSGLFGLCLVATAILFVLQAAGAIHISWWLVFAPLLGYAALGLSALVLIGIGIFMVFLFGVIVWLIEGRP